MLESKIVPINKYDWRRECQTNPTGWTEAAFFENMDKRNSERDDLEKVPQLEGTPWSTLPSQPRYFAITFFSFRMGVGFTHVEHKNVKKKQIAGMLCFW